MGWRHRRDRRFEQVDCGEEALGVGQANRYVTEAEAFEAVEGYTGDERPRIVGRDDALAALNARGGVRARAGAHPDFEVGGAERNIAGRPGRAARRIDAHDVRWSGGEMRPDRLLARTRGAQLVLLGERQRLDGAELPDSAVRCEAGALELPAVEPRMFEEILDLLQVERRVGARLAFPRRALDLRIDHRHQARSASATCAIASSPLEAR